MSITVNPQLIFQWLVLVGERCKELSSLFKYELYCFPSALFESSSLPLQPNKPVLANALWKSIHESQQEPSEDVQYVLDGGALLHRLPWPQGSIYNDSQQSWLSGRAQNSQAVDQSSRLKQH